MVKTSLPLRILCGCFFSLSLASFFPVTAQPNRACYIADNSSPSPPGSATAASSSVAPLHMCTCKQVNCNAVLPEDQVLYATEEECSHAIETKQKEKKLQDSSHSSSQVPTIAARVKDNRRARRLQKTPEDKVLDATLRNILTKPEDYREGVMKIAKQVLNGGGELLTKYSSGLSTLFKFVMEEINNSGGLDMEKAMRLMSLFGGDE